MRSIDIHSHLTPQCCLRAMDRPHRFAGFATIPMQEFKAAIAELDRPVNQLGLVGAMIDDKVNRRTCGEPNILPPCQAAEQMGSLMFSHPGCE